MFKINNKQIKEFEAELKAFAHRAYPFATKNTVNKAAFVTQKVARLEISQKMVERNKFTRQSIRVNPAKGLKVSQQEAVVGSTLAYMEDQEFGATIRKKSIPTGYSAGQQGQRPRTRLPRKPNKMANIRLKHGLRSKAKTRRGRNTAIIKQAVKSGSKYVYLDLGRREGIFKVVGGKRNPKIKMVHSTSMDSVTIPRNPWLRPTTLIIAKRIPKFYRDALIFQLKRNGLFKD